MLIYKATINGKSYIGLFSGKYLSKRKREHKNDALCKRDNTYFHNVIRKYGWQNVDYEILENYIQDFELLKEKERFYILKYDTYRPNGYNMTLGGDGAFGYKHTEEAKKKIGIKHKGKIVSEESIQKFRSTIKNYTQEKKDLIHKNRSKAHIGRSCSEEKRRKISNTSKGRVFTKEHIKKLKEARKLHKKECVVCNKVFFGVIYAKYCSKKCCDHNGYLAYKKRRLNKLD